MQKLFNAYECRHEIAKRGGIPKTDESGKRYWQVSDAVLQLLKELAKNNLTFRKNWRKVRFEYTKGD